MCFFYGLKGPQRLLGSLAQDARLGEEDALEAAEAFWKESLSKDNSAPKFSTEVFWLTLRGVRLCFKSDARLLAAADGGMGVLSLAVVLCFFLFFVRNSVQFVRGGVRSVVALLSKESRGRRAGADFAGGESYRRRNFWLADGKETSSLAVCREP